MVWIVSNYARPIEYLWMYFLMEDHGNKEVKNNIFHAYSFSYLFIIFNNQ